MIWYERLCTGILGIILIIMAITLAVLMIGLRDDPYMYVTVVILFGIFAAVIGTWGLMMVWAPDELGAHLKFNLEASEEIDESDTEK